VTPASLFLLVVLVVCSWPALRLLASPSFRQVAPRQWTVLVAVGLVMTAVLLVVAVFQPAWLPVITVVVVLVAGASAWRSRRIFGGGSGLPPGSLSPWRSIEALVERDFYSSQAKQHGPVFKMAQFHRGVICVVGLDRGHRVLREYQKNLGPSVQPFNREVEGGFLRYMDDGTHRRYAGFFRSALSPSVVSASEPTAIASAREELEDLTLASSRGQPISPEPYLNRFVNTSFLSVLFGVHPGSESLERFERIYPPLGKQPLGAPLHSGALDALNEMRQWVVLESESMRGQDEPLPSSALGALVRSDETLPDATAVDNLLFIHKISSDNVVALLRWLVKFLGDHPAWSERLQMELESGCESDLSERIVLETLRLAQSEYVYREIVEDFELDGFRFPRKWLLRVCVRESHADQNVFVDAETFNPDRFLNHRFDSSQYSPFGFGPHACNGVHLTMMIATTWIESLCGGFDWSIVRDGPVEKEFRHWSHWRPSQRLAVTVARKPRADAGSLIESPLASAS
jgi:cytochrome P450